MNKALDNSFGVCEVLFLYHFLAKTQSNKLKTELKFNHMLYQQCSLHWSSGLYHYDLLNESLLFEQQLNIYYATIVYGKHEWNNFTVNFTVFFLV